MNTITVASKDTLSYEPLCLYNYMIFIIIFMAYNVAVYSYKHVVISRTKALA